MQHLLGFFFILSLLPMRGFCNGKHGFSLKCDECYQYGDKCSPIKVQCAKDIDGCITLLLEIKQVTVVTAAMTTPPPAAAERQEMTPARRTPAWAPDRQETAASKPHITMGCANEAECMKLKGEIGNPLPAKISKYYPEGASVKNVECTKGEKVKSASPASFSGHPSSFLLAFFAFLIMNSLF